MKKSEVLQSITEHLEMLNNNSCRNIKIYISGDAVQNGNDNFVELQFYYKDKYLVGEFINCSDSNADETAIMLISFYTRIIMRLERREAIK